MEKRTIKKIFAALFIAFCMTGFAASQTFTDYANKMREEIETLKEINKQRDDIIEMKDIENNELKQMLLESNQKTDEAIKEAENACNKIEEQNNKIKHQNKILLIVFWIFVIKLLISIALIVIKYCYKISVPYWLNALL